MPTDEELKRAFKAFKKRLKLTRLDDESRLGRRANSARKSGMNWSSAASFRAMPTGFTGWAPSKAASPERQIGGGVDGGVILCADTGVERDPRRDVDPFFRKGASYELQDSGPRYHSGAGRCRLRQQHTGPCARQVNSGGVHGRGRNHSARPDNRPVHRPQGPLIAVG